MPQISPINWLLIMLLITFLMMNFMKITPLTTATKSKKKIFNSKYKMTW